MKQELKQAVDNIGTVLTQGRIMLQGSPLMGSEHVQLVRDLDLITKELEKKSKTETGKKKD